MLAVFAVVALVVAVVNGSKPAAIAVAACGVIALLIFLLLDLPDANDVGTLDDAAPVLLRRRGDPPGRASG